jgi:hypothetical protein
MRDGWLNELPFGEAANSKDFREMHEGNGLILKGY